MKVYRIRAYNKKLQMYELLYEEYMDKKTAQDICKAMRLVCPTCDAKVKVFIK